jgi:hypothetical protein
VPRRCEDDHRLTLPRQREKGFRNVERVEEQQALAVVDRV